MKPDPCEHEVFDISGLPVDIQNIIFTDTFILFISHVLPHEGLIKNASFNPNEKHPSILTATPSSKTVKIWNLDGTLKHEMAHILAIDKAFFSPKGSFICIIFFDGLARIYNYENVKIIAALTHAKKINSVHFDHTESYIVTASDDQNASLWDIKGHLICILPHNKAVNEAEFNTAGSHILTASADEYAHLWDLQGKLIRSFYHTFGTLSAHFNTANTHIITTSHNGTAKIWNLQGVCLKELTSSANANEIMIAQYSPADTHIFATTLNGSLMVWDTKTWTQRFIKHDSLIHSAEWNKKNTHIITASNDCTTAVWNIVTQKVIRLLHEQSINSAHFNTAQNIVITASGDCTAALWSLNGKPLALLPHTEKVHEAIFDQTDSYILTRSENEALLWERIELNKAYSIIKKHKKYNSLFLNLLIRDLQLKLSIKHTQENKPLLQKECFYLRFLPKNLKNYFLSFNDPSIKADILNSDIKLLHSSPIQKKEGSEYSGLMYDDIEENVPTILEEYAHLVKDIKRTRLEKKQYTLSAKSLATIKKLPKELYETILSGLKVPLKKKALTSLKSSLEI